MPEKYRLPVVLCDLEGSLRREAAARLGWPEGTVAGRLSLGRAMLARRLARLGLTVSGGVLATVLSGGEADASVPAGLLDSMVRAGASGAYRPETVALAKGVIRAMSKTKLLTLAVAVLVVTLGGGFTLWAQFGGRTEDPAKPPPVVANPAAEPAPAKVPKELLEKRIDAARKVYQQNLTRLNAGQGLPSELFGWSERWLEAELALAEKALAEKAGDRAKPLRDHLDRTQEVERRAVGFAKTGQGRQADADAATYYRLEAEIRLHREGVKPQEPPAEKGKPEK